MTRAWCRDSRSLSPRLGAAARPNARAFSAARPEKQNVGLPSDRLYIEWRIATDRADQRLRGTEAVAPLDDAERDGVRYLLRAEGDRPGPVDPPRGATHLLAAVPVDIQSIKAHDRGLALA